jgi:hypothetical protein
MSSILSPNEVQDRYPSPRFKISGVIERSDTNNGLWPCNLPHLGYIVLNTPE